MEPSKEEVAKRAEFIARRQAMHHGMMTRGGDNSSGVPKFFVRYWKPLAAFAGCFFIGSFYLSVSSYWNTRGVCISCEMQRQVAEKLFNGKAIQEVLPETQKPQTIIPGGRGSR